MPRGQDLLKFGFGVRLSVFTAFQFHPLLGVAQFLCRISSCRFNDTVSHTALEKYHALDISGTSGSIKKPAIAIGSEITPSMINSLKTSVVER